MKFANLLIVDWAGLKWWFFREVKKTQEGEDKLWDHRVEGPHITFKDGRPRWNNINNHQRLKT